MGIDKWDGERLGTKELYVKEGPEVERTGHKVKELLKEGHWGRASNQSFMRQDGHGPGHAGLCKLWDEFWALASGQEEAFGIFKQGIKKFYVFRSSWPIVGRVVWNGGD